MVTELYEKVGERGSSGLSILRIEQFARTALPSPMPPRSSCRE
jgi:hypothetical protein